MAESEQQKAFRSALDRILRVHHTMRCWAFLDRDELCDCLADVQEIAQVALDDIEVREALDGDSD